jgi:hypothetical protein
MAGHLTSIEAVLGSLGLPVETAPVAQINALLGVADAAVQAYCGRQWLSGAITNEVYTPDGPLLYLRQRPISSVESIVGHRAYQATTTTLVAGTDYAVQDLARGLVTLRGIGQWQSGGSSSTYGRGLLPTHPREPWTLPYSYLTVSYTPAAPVPADVSLAAALLVGTWLQTTTQGITPDIKTYSVGQELTVTRFDPSASALPPPVATLLAPYRAGLVFA